MDGHMAGHIVGHMIGHKDRNTYRHTDKHRDENIVGHTDLWTKWKNNQVLFVVKLSRLME